jgi:hypothetical protein
MSLRAKTAPTHRATLIVPHEGTYVSEVRPVGRAKGVRGYCKYCYRTHSQWWLMPTAAEQLRRLDSVLGALSDTELNDRFGDRDPDDKPTRALLCGYCEHTSLECFI